MKRTAALALETRTRCERSPRPDRKPASPWLSWSRLALAIALMAFAGTGQGAERVFDLTGVKPDTTPPGWRSLLSGSGPVGDWKVLLDDVPPTFAPLTPNAAQTAKIPVIAQVSEDRTDERFPMLVYDDEIYGDFTFTVRFKTVRGTAERMAGIVFRLQDERNYYVVRASSLGRTFRFYRVANGQRDNPIGPTLEIPSGVWHELSVTCEGNRIRFQLDGQAPLPEVTDNSYSEGKIGLWTKSDSVTYFTGLRLRYTPREPLARSLVRDALQRYPRLLGLSIYSTTTKRPELHVVASTDESDLGKAGGKYEQQCISNNEVLSGKVDRKAVVTMPLHDRNGDPIAAVRLLMQSFPGQTDQNAVARATPIVKSMQQRITSLKELTE